MAVVRQDWIGVGVGMPEPDEVWDLRLLRAESLEPEVLYHGPVAAFPCAECPDTAPLDVDTLGWSYDGRLAVSVSQFLAPAAPALQDVWLIDVDTLDAEPVLRATRFGDAEILSGGAVLSPNGAMLAYLPPPVGYVVEVLDPAGGDRSRFEMPGEVGCRSRIRCAGRPTLDGSASVSSTG